MAFIVKNFGRLSYVEVEEYDESSGSDTDGRDNGTED